MTDQGQTTDLESARQRDRLEDAINHLSLGIVVFNDKREVVFCNARYAEMYGLSPEQAYVLVSVTGDLRLSEIVDVPNPLVSALLPLDIFEG
mgnify:CR=1 FL=1